MKVKELLEYLEGYEDYEIEIFSNVYTLDTIDKPEEIMEVGMLNLYNTELITKKIILEYMTGEKLMYMSDLDFVKKEICTNERNDI